MTSENTLIVKRVEIIPIEVVIRNVVAGSLVKRTGLPRDTSCASRSSSAITRATSSAIP